jgi:hypothetical protein
LISFPSFGLKNLQSLNSREWGTKEQRMKQTTCAKFSTLFSFQQSAIRSEAIIPVANSPNGNPNPFVLHRSWDIYPFPDLPLIAKIVNIPKPFIERAIIQDHIH